MRRWAASRKRMRALRWRRTRRGGSTVPCRSAPLRQILLVHAIDEQAVAQIVERRHDALGALIDVGVGAVEGGMRVEQHPPAYPRLVFLPCGYERILRLPRLLGQHVETDREQPARTQPLEQRRGVADRTARRVDEISAGLDDRHRF